MTTKPKVTWDTEASNIVRQPDSYISSNIFGDRGYLFYIDVLEEQMFLFPASIKTWRILVREYFRRKQTLEFVFSTDETYSNYEYNKEVMLREAIRKVNNIEPLDYYE